MFGMSALERFLPRALFGDLMTQSRLITIPHGEGTTGGNDELAALGFRASETPNRAYQ